MKQKPLEHVDVNSKWMFTRTSSVVDCPRCGATAGNYCQTPKGRKALEPHTERCIELSKAEGRY